MFWLHRWRRVSGPADEQLRALENWVRLRFHLTSSDSMIAIIGAFGRLTDAGMDEHDATDTILRILRDSEPAAHQWAQRCPDAQPLEG
jgi:hypothetical protein